MIDPILNAFSCLPFDSLQLRFMQQALLALLFLTPMTAMLGVEIVNFRMAFYSDAIGHSAFAGAGLGLILSIEPHLAMPVFGVLVGLSIVALKRRTSISSDVAWFFPQWWLSAWPLSAVLQAWPGICSSFFLAIS